ncbi:MAG: response regulator [Rudaea sp.]
MAQSTQGRVLLASDDPETIGIVERTLTKDGFKILHTASGEEALGKAQRQPFELAIVDANLPVVDGFTLVRQLRENQYTRFLPILLLTSRDDIANKVVAFEAGVSDYLSRPFQPEELSYRVRNLLAHGKLVAQAQGGARHRGRVIALFGTKGGVGRTTIAANLALALQRRSKRGTVLVDADFFFGDVGLHLNLTPTHTILDLVDRLDDIDADLVDQVLIQHSSGLRVLLPPYAPEKAETITAAHIERILRGLIDLYDYVIVDCETYYDDKSMVILEHADQILLVVKPEVGPLKNMGVFLNLVDRLSLPIDKVHIIMNRAGSRAGIEAEQIERSFKRPVEFRIQTAGRSVVLSVNRGVPLIVDQPKHPVSVQINRIADFIVENTPKSAAAPASVRPAKG